MVGMKDTRVKNSGEARTLSRQHINKTMRYIVQCFKWGAAVEHVPVSVWQALTSVPGPKKGRTEAREAKRDQPVSDADVDATIPHLSPSVAAMVNLQRLTGMRPGEVVELRPCDVTRRIDGIWCYRPPRFNMEHHEDSERIVLLGPKAQAILKPWLERDAEAPCFSPAETIAWWKERFAWLKISLGH